MELVDEAWMDSCGHLGWCRVLMEVVCVIGSMILTIGICIESFSNVLIAFLTIESFVWKCIESYKVCGPGHGSDLLKWDDQEDQREQLHVPMSLLQESVFLLFRLCICSELC